MRTGRTHPAGPLAPEPPPLLGRSKGRRRKPPAAANAAPAPVVEPLPLTHDVHDSPIAVTMDRQCLALHIQERCGRVKLSTEQRKSLVTRKRMRAERTERFPFTQACARRIVAYDALLEALECRCCLAQDRCRGRRR